MRIQVRTPFEPRCTLTPFCLRFHGLTLLFFILFLAFYIWQIISFILDIHRLTDMYKFYTYLLKIPDVCLFILIPISSPCSTLSRLTYKPFPGRKLSAALARFAKKIPSLPFLPGTPLLQHTHPPMTRRQPNSTLTISPIV